MGRTPSNHQGGFSGSRSCFAFFQEFKYPLGKLDLSFLLGGVLRWEMPKGTLQRMYSEAVGAFLGFQSGLQGLYVCSSFLGVVYNT